MWSIESSINSGTGDGGLAQVYEIRRACRGRAADPTPGVRVTVLAEIRSLYIVYISSYSIARRARSAGR